MIKFPLIEIIDTAIAKIFKRPVDYLPERWKHCKRVMLGCVLVGILLGTTFKIFGINGNIVALPLLVIAIVGIALNWTDKKDTEWKHRWWRGEEPKWKWLIKW